METDSVLDKHAVMNKDGVVGHLMKEKSEKFTKIVFFILKADVSIMATVKINRKAVNKG